MGVVEWEEEWVIWEVVWATTTWEEVWVEEWEVGWEEILGVTTVEICSRGKATWEWVAEISGVEIKETILVVEIKEDLGKDIQVHRSGVVIRGATIEAWVEG